MYWAFFDAVMLSSKRRDLSSADDRAMGDEEVFQIEFRFLRRDDVRRLEESCGRKKRFESIPYRFDGYTDVDEEISRHVISFCGIRM